MTPVLLEPDPPITTDITSLFIASHIIVVRIAPENPDSWEKRERERKRQNGREQVRGREWKAVGKEGSWECDWNHRRFP